MMAFKLLPWVSPWHDFSEVYNKQLSAIQSLLGLAVLFFHDDNASTKGMIFMGDYQQRVPLLSLHGSCLPELRL